MRQHRAGLEARGRETNPCENEPHCIGKREAPGEHRDKNGDGEKSDRMAESNVHRPTITGASTNRIV